MLWPSRTARVSEKFLMVRVRPPFPCSKFRVAVNRSIHQNRHKLTLKANFHPALSQRDGFVIGSRYDDHRFLGFGNYYPDQRTQTGLSNDGYSISIHLRSFAKGKLWTAMFLIRRIKVLVFYSLVFAYTPRRSPWLFKFSNPKPHHPKAASLFLRPPAGTPAKNFSKN